MLWMFRRVVFGPLTRPENQRLSDLNSRELFIFAPIVGLIFFMGVYPQPFLQRMKPAVELVLSKVYAAAGTAAVGAPPAGDNKNSDGR
jgi:NADH-quinone oxidoreductase subunit M